MNNEIKENNDLILFENNKIRRQMYNGKWYYSIVDVIAILTDSKDPSAYWRKLKQCLILEGTESVTNCHGLKLISKDKKWGLLTVQTEKQFLELFNLFHLQTLNLLNCGLQD